ncbi:MAG: tetratricopeptide repeat protein [Chloroherpetonaceae bacterium]
MTETIDELEIKAQSAKERDEQITALNKLAEALIEREPERTRTLAERALNLLAQSELKLFQKGQTAFALAMLGMAELKVSNSTKAIQYLTDAKELATEIGDKPLLLKILGALGNANWNISNYTDALRLHHERLKLAETLDNTMAIATSLHNIGNAYFKLSELDKALDVYQKSLSLKEKLGNEHEIAMTLMNIGNVYYVIDDLEKACDYYEQSLTLKQKSGAPLASLAHTLMNIGNIFYRQKKFDEALRRFEHAKDALQDSPDLLVRAQILGNIASALSGLERHEESLQRQLECLELREKINHIQGVIISHNVIGLCYHDLGEPEKAESHLLKGLELAESQKATQETADLLIALAKLYKSRKLFEKATHCYERYQEVERERFSEVQAKKLREMQAMYETEQARREAEREKERSIELEKALSEAENQRKLAIEANQIKTQLLSIAAHDLKSPLQSIIGFSAVIKETPQSDILNIYDYATHVESAANRMLSLINEMLRSNEFDIGEITLNFRLARVDKILESVVYENQFIAKKKSQTLLIEHTEEIELMLDGSRIREVFENLISNAVKYSPREKTIRLSMKKLPIKSNHDRQATDLVEDVSEVVRITVKDEGQGLSKTDMTKLFGRFQRLSARPTDEETSTGLGLFIVKKIVDLHGGTVWAESEGKGKGATFCVELPIRTHANAP